MILMLTSSASDISLLIYDTSMSVVSDITDISKLDSSVQSSLGIFKK